jgi:hypothetical protein
MAAVHGSDRLKEIAMCCALGILAILGPRALVIFWWLVDPVRWNLVFGGAIVPILGFLFLPWTTLMYVLIWSVGGLDPIGWLLVGMAVLVDLASYGGGAIGNKDQIQSYYRQ